MTLLSRTVKSKSSNNWVSEYVRSRKNFGLEENQIKTKVSKNGLCIKCKGSRYLCGKTRCPLLLRVNYFLKTIPLISSKEISGVSPPSIFIGRIGYPNVYAGPLVPPIHEDTSIYDLPEKWFGRPIDQIVGFRSLLVRGKKRIHVNKFTEAGKIFEKTLELALADKSVETELKFSKKPKGSIFLDSNVQPFGPSAVIKKFHVGNTRFDNRLEKAYYDTDLKSAQAVLDLYSNGVNVTKIQKAFSVGAFGIKKNRRLVPTRWSITAVDDIISKNLVDRVKRYPIINEFRIYESTYLDNIFQILMLPSAWSYESMEAWYPGTVWNQNGEKTVIFSDYENYNGRSKYAKIGGCYYSARLAVCEQLIKEKRQATAIVLREIHPGYIMPIGVWQVRENVRNAMKQKPQLFKSLNDCLKFVRNKLEIPITQWIIQGELLKRSLYQKKISEFLK
ncbi:MAG: Nre family DNA repair protein [Candidatus Bathyarchaeota archaeon]|nr:Nre family DNA repair protein [Candidatus Bathyarchaeota archaeon]